jgi:hypothetical protein
MRKFWKNNSIDLVSPYTHSKKITDLKNMVVFQISILNDQFNTCNDLVYMALQQGYQYNQIVLW